MDKISELYSSHPIEHWFKIEPEDQQYARFSPAIIYAAHKISDVYYAFGHGRSYLSDYNCNDFGQLIAKNDDLHLKYIKSKFLQSSLAFYNYSIDLSWQVVWFYLCDDTYLLMEDSEYYGKFAQKCTYSNLLELVRYRKKSYFENHLISFFDNDLVRKIRLLYNYVKHRGTLYTEGLGVQYDCMIMEYQIDHSSHSFDMITRRTIDLDEWEDRLIQFDKLFHEYFEKIISWVIPKNFIDLQFDFTYVIQHYHERLDFRENQLESYRALFKEFYID